jgi:hypothetical protein
VVHMCCCVVCACVRDFVCLCVCVSVLALMFVVVRATLDMLWRGRMREGRGGDRSA